MHQQAHRLAIYSLSNLGQLPRASCPTFAYPHSLASTILALVRSNAFNCPCPRSVIARLLLFFAVSHKQTASCIVLRVGFSTTIPCLW